MNDGDLSEGMNTYVFKVKQSFTAAEKYWCLICFVFDVCNLFQFKYLWNIDELDAVIGTTLITMNVDW